MAYPTNQATIHDEREESASCPVIEVSASVGGLPEWATYTVEFGRQLPGAVGEACSPEVGEPS